MDEWDCSIIIESGIVLGSKQEDGGGLRSVSYKPRAVDRVRVEGDAKKLKK